MKLLVLAFLPLLANLVQSANILAMFPFPAKSHHAVFQPIVIGLAKSGHKVTYVTPNVIAKAPPNLKQVELANAMARFKTFMEENEVPKTDFFSKAMKWLADNWCNMIIRQIGVILGEMILKEPQVQDIINDPKAKYDLILLESTFGQEEFAALSHKFGAPIVEVIPAPNLHWTYFLHGVPYDTNYIVDVEVNYSDKMTFKERLINTAYSMLNRFTNSYFFINQAQALADKYITYPGWESRPSLIDLVKNTSILLVNSHVAVNYPYPLPPNVQLIGGINIQDKPNPLPKDIKDFMDGAKDGVIYFTMGSHIEVSTTLGDNLKNEFLKAFGKLKQRILWKWETDFPNVPANIKISKWFPQQDILAHKNMKLFITHGGGLSLTESIYHGVPVVGIPILGDQPKNVNHAKVTGYGLHLDLKNISEPAISWAINEVLSNPKYTETAKERSAIFKDKSQTPLQTALFWIEYVLRHEGAHHLKPAITSMPWCQQALLDVYLALAAIIIVPIMIFYCTLKCICRCIFCRKSSKSKTLKKKRE